MFSRKPHWFSYLNILVLDSGIFGKFLCIFQAIFLIAPKYGFFFRWSIDGFSHKMATTFALRNHRTASEFCLKRLLVWARNLKNSSLQK
ncbi:hypothetical protein RIF29_40106 [Crotalaria pallida]|uniref:Uncharacterized protein n=1 Tax=Crotalaria pallida TaxID=3830 RepID=A0AAN9HU06_CROPI